MNRPQAISGLIGQKQHFELFLESYWELVHMLEDWSYVFLIIHPIRREAATFCISLHLHLCLLYREH